MVGGTVDNTKNENDRFYICKVPTTKIKGNEGLQPCTKHTKRKDFSFPSRTAENAYGHIEEDN